MADLVLSVSGVSAGYSRRRVVSGIDLTLSRGEIVGLLGANGSGKSTLIRAITGQLPLLSGRVTIAGTDLSSRPEQAKASLGLAIDPSDLPAALTGRQYLQLVASIRGCGADDWPHGDVAALLGLAPWLDVPVSEYSFGTRMKASIAAALLGAPPLLIFDESLNGLDPVAAWGARRMFKALAASGRHGLIVSTHVVATVPGFCTRAMLLADGRIAKTWDATELAGTAHAPGAFAADLVATLSAG